MTRTLGSKDKKKRKKRKLYAGKPIKKKRKKFGKFVPYVSKRKRDAPIKLWMIEERPMSKEGYMNFSKKIRPYIRRIVYIPRLRIDVDPYQISNKELVEKLCLEYLWEGTWLIRGFSRGRNKFHVKPVKLCKVKITNHPEGLKAKMINNYRLFRYFFWSGK